jgi:hypothetical protein
MSTLVVSNVNNSTGTSLLPLPGTVIFFAAPILPSGWIKCNGASLSTTTYGALFATIGYTFGGSGASFNVPDLRGEFLRGWDDNRSIDTGRVFGAFQSDAMQGHKHTADRAILMQQFGDGIVDGISLRALSSDASYFTLTDRMLVDPTTDGINGTPRTGPDTRPRNLALLACIKF